MLTLLIVMGLYDTLIGIWCLVDPRSSLSRPLGIASLSMGYSLIDSGCPWVFTLARILI